MSKAPINILIVEDNKSFKKSLEQMIRLNQEFNHAGSFNSAEAYLDRLKKDPPQANVLLLDLCLPGKNGITLIPVVQELQPEIKILVLTQDDDFHTTLEAIRLGVSGYILKNSSITNVELAINEINEGGCVIDPQLSRLVLEAHESEGDGSTNPLTARERQVLKLLAMGYVKKEVADRLDISYRTVAVHTESIYKKLSVPNVAAAVATAIRKGHIS